MFIKLCLSACNTFTNKNMLDNKKQLKKKKIKEK